MRGEDAQLIPHRAAEELAKSREGVRLLTRVIEDRGRTELRQAAVYGFAWGKLRAPQMAMLQKVFENPLEDPTVRGQAAEALGPRLRFRSPRQRQRRRHLRAISAMVRGLDDPAPEVRFWSIFALAHSNNEWLLPKLREIAAVDLELVRGFWTVRQEALWAINWILRRDLDRDPHTL